MCQLPQEQCLCGPDDRLLHVPYRHVCRSDDADPARRVPDRLRNVPYDKPGLEAIDIRPQQFDVSFNGRTSRGPVRLMPQEQCLCRAPHELLRLSSDGFCRGKCSTPHRILNRLYDMPYDFGVATCDIRPQQDDISSHGGAHNGGVRQLPCKQCLCRADDRLLYMSYHDFCRSDHPGTAYRVSDRLRNMPYNKSRMEAVDVQPCHSDSKIHPGYQAPERGVCEVPSERSELHAVLLPEQRVPQHLCGSQLMESGMKEICAPNFCFLTYLLAGLAGDPTHGPGSCRGIRGKGAEG
jgi:hypothetical protein